MAKNTATKSNVVTFRRSDFDQVYHRSHAGWIAIEKMIDRLGVEKAAKRKAAKGHQTEALKAYQDGRPHDEKATAMLAAIVEHDRIQAMVATLREATIECRGAAERAASDQGDMFDTGIGATVTGMGWASAPTRRAIFSCLQAMSANGEKLDPHQADLLVDLGGAGLDAMDFGLSASEAVESEGVEAEPAGDDSDDDFPLD